MAKPKKGKKKAKVETEDEEEEKAKAAPVVVPVPAVGDLFDLGNVGENIMPVMPESQAPANDAWGIVPGDSASNVNSNRGGWGGATAAPTPPPKRASINVQHELHDQHIAVEPAALSAQLHLMHQQQEILNRHNNLQNFQQQEKKQRGRQRNNHDREAEVDEYNDGGWGVGTGGGGAWPGVEEPSSNAWPQPNGNGDTWGMPAAVLPGGFGAGFAPAGPSPGHPATKGESKRGNKKKVESSPNVAAGGWIQDQHPAAWGTAPADDWAVHDGVDDWVDGATHQHQHQHAQASGGGGWNTLEGGGGGGGWGQNDMTGTGWANNAAGAAATAWPAPAGNSQPTNGWPVPQKAHAPSVANTSSWGGWRPTSEHQHAHTAKGHSNIPKVTVQAPSSAGAKTVVPAKQHSGLFASLFPFGRSKGSRASTAQPPEQTQKDKHVRQESKKVEAKIKKKPTPQNSPWVHIGPNIEEEDEDDYDDYDDDDDDEEEEEEEEEEDYYNGGNNGGNNMWMAQDTQNGWVDPGLMRHSKAYALAHGHISNGHTPNGHTPASRMNQSLQGDEVPIVESYLLGLESAKRALYSQDRLAKERIHWSFDPRKDVRVAQVLDWVDARRRDLTRLGLSKFIEQKERGALFVNVDYRDPTNPYSPAFDFLTYKDIQDTFDRTLQESLAFYDPMSQVLVFVILLSRSANSMAIWRRKLVVPNDLKASFAPHISPILASLKPKYPIFLDEPIEEQKKKKKWLRWGKS